MRVSVKVTGDKAIIGALSMMNVVGRMQLERAVDTSSAAILAGALARVPSVTGELKKSLRRKISKSGMSAAIMAGYGELQRKGKAAGIRARGGRANDTKGVYAPVVEFGSARSVAKPFLFPALEAEKPSFIAACNTAMNNTVATAEKGV
jgi:HK97 gp10 family phage protein